ncbi:MAG: class I SAM-dependent methyltransferase [Desulfamplus sp.]|nr:class I SAM-dependent methyltransferase [Desulfamplus sp.]
MLTNNIKTLTINDFVRLFGISEGELEGDCPLVIKKADFRYTLLDQRERDEIIGEVLRHIDSGNLTTAGSQSLDRWEKGWKENLEDFKKNRFDPKSLIPKYIRPNQVLRLEGDYIRSHNRYFELDFYTVLRLWLFGRYIKNVDHVYEFGCGPGYNLHLLASQYPDKTLTGLDWTPSAIELVNLIGQKCGMNIIAKHFDMFNPDNDFKLTSGSLAITFGGLEQLGENFKPFIDYLIAQSPSCVIHVEPIYELYRENELIDYLAMRFHRVRKYLIGLLPYLQECQQVGKIKIECIHRLHFGSLFHDGWSVVVYRPICTEE